MIYKAIGMLVVKLGSAFVKRRYGRQLRAAGGVAVVVLGIGAYLATRSSVDEG